MKMPQCKWCGDELIVDDTGLAIAVYDPKDPWGAINLSEEEKVAIAEWEQNFDALRQALYENYQRPIDMRDLINARDYMNEQSEKGQLIDARDYMNRQSEKGQELFRSAYKRLEMSNGLICIDCYHDHEYGEEG